MTLAKIENCIIAEMKKASEENKRHEAATKEINKTLSDLKEQKRLLLDGLDPERISDAKNILKIYIETWSNGRKSNGYSDLVDLAMKDLATGYEHMKKEFYGAKNYEGWTGQRCDCSYGMGPRHGSITFSIGLNKRADLTDSEIENCLYYLGNFSKIHPDLKMSVTT